MAGTGQPSPVAVTQKKHHNLAVEEVALKPSLTPICCPGPQGAVFSDKLQESGWEMNGPVLELASGRNPSSVPRGQPSHGQEAQACSGLSSLPEAPALPILEPRSVVDLDWPLGALVSASAPDLVETLASPPPSVGTDGGSSAPPGNVPHDPAELLGGPGGGEPDHRGLGELPARLDPQDEAVLGSAGLGADGRNRTQVRGGGDGRPCP